MPARTAKRDRPVDDIDSDSDNTSPCDSTDQRPLPSSSCANANVNAPSRDTASPLLGDYVPLTGASTTNASTNGATSLPQAQQQHKQDPPMSQASSKPSGGGNLYQLFGVEPTCSNSELQRAYKKKALIFHPDRHSASPQAIKDTAAQQFATITEAYRVLCDPQLRATHDVKHNVNLQGRVASVLRYANRVHGEAPPTAPDTMASADANAADDDDDSEDEEYVPAARKAKPSVGLVVQESLHTTVLFTLTRGDIRDSWGLVLCPRTLRVIETIPASPAALARIPAGVAVRAVGGEGVEDPAHFARLTATQLEVELKLDGCQVLRVTAARSILSAVDGETAALRGETPSAVVSPEGRLVATSKALFRGTDEWRLVADTWVVGGTPPGEADGGQPAPGPRAVRQVRFMPTVETGAAPVPQGSAGDGIPKTTLYVLGAPRR